MSYEYQVKVNGVVHGMDRLQSVNIVHPLFDKLSVGNACSAELTMSYWPETFPPKAAEIQTYEREVGTRDWKPLGTFYIDTRSEKRDLLSVVAYDSMLRAEDYWPIDLEKVYPIKMTEAVDIICREMEIELDERTYINPTHEIDTQPSAKTMREVLCSVAAANGGNWIVTRENKLLLVPLFGSMPEETHYLITEEGSPLTFGGTRILI